MPPRPGVGGRGGEDIAPVPQSSLVELTLCSSHCSSLVAELRAAPELMRGPAQPSTSTSVPRCRPPQRRTAAEGIPRTEAQLLAPPRGARTLLRLPRAVRDLCPGKHGVISAQHNTGEEERMVARNPCWAAAGAGGWPAVLLRTSLSAVTTPATAATLQLQSLVKHNELASDCCLVVLVLVAIKTWNNQLHPHHHQPSNCSLRGRVTILVSSNQL